MLQVVRALIIYKSDVIVLFSCAILCYFVLQNIPEGVQTVLDLFLVKPIHIESGYYVVYSTSQTTRYRHLVDLIERSKKYFSYKFA